jgi:hypothetical protein
MNTNRSIESSRRFFSTLLNLYPRDHRSEYADSMRQVFTDQCRDAQKEKGIFGIILLWLRILPDLGYTAIVEHLTSPRAAWGLMEPVPNAPLPWKGVFLILLPGLVYLVSQIAQLTGEPWYLTVYYRAAFYLILPVLVVWAITRRFPIWGLIPVGLLFRLVKEMGYQFIILHPGAFSSNPILNLILNAARLIENNLWIQSAIFAILIIFLAFRYARYNRLSRGFWFWTGAFLFIVVLRIVIDVTWYIPSMDQLPAETRQQILQDFFQWNIASLLYNASALLLLVFIGTLFIPRHGFFSIFILVGYVLPVIVVGTPWTEGENPAMFLFLSIGVLAYRSLLSLVAPIWMSRNPTRDGKKKVIMFSIATALVVHAVLQFYPVFFNLAERVAYSYWIQNVVMEELILVIAFLLAMSLYQDSRLTDGDMESENPDIHGLVVSQKIE